MPEAIAAMDDAGEFRWRLRNAARGRGHFLQALAGWHASLDAKAYQEEQAAGQIVTTAVVFWNGLFVLVIMSSVFLFLVSVIDAGELW